MRNITKGGPGSGSCEGPGKRRYRKVTDATAKLTSSQKADALKKLKLEASKRSGEGGQQSILQSSTENRVEGKAPVIKETDRKAFLNSVVAPGGVSHNIKVDSDAASNFAKTGDVEAFISELYEVGEKDSFIGALRVKTLYGEKFGGIDVAKSESLTSVWEKSNSAASKMSEKELGDIERYTGSDYVDLNDALRSGGKLDQNQKSIVDSVSKIVDDVGEWKSSATIYHGVSSSSEKTRSSFLDRAKKAVKDGSIWEEKGVLSTSASHEMSQDWVSSSAGGGIVMRIKAKRGAVISSFTGLSDQQEIIQKPGSKYRVTKVSEETRLSGNGKITIVDFEQI